MRTYKQKEIRNAIYNGVYEDIKSFEGFDDLYYNHKIRLSTVGASYGVYGVNGKVWEVERLDDNGDWVYVGTYATASRNSYAFM